MSLLQRELNILSEPTSDRTSKKRALEKIYKETSQKNPQLDSNSIIKHLLKSLKDPIEKCRELSINIIESLIASNQVQVTLFLNQIIPVFVQQLGQLQIIEPSEEIRLKILMTLKLIIKSSNSDYAPFVDDTFKILAQTFNDNFQDIRKESCNIVMILCKNNIRAVAHLGGSVVKMILPSLNHRHSSVRTIALQAIDEAMIVDATAIDDVINPLMALLLDKTPVVRKQIYTLARDWLSKLIDRHVYGAKILPLLYAGLTDEIQELVQLTTGFVDEIGAQYERENTARIKDEMDYSDGHENEIIDRPRVGSRHLARDNIMKISAKLVEGLGDWNLETRYKSIQIFTVFLKFTESQITGYIGTIFPSIYKILAGDEPHVMNQTIKFMESIGFYVNPDTTLTIVLKSLVGEHSNTLTSYRIGCLKALEGLLLGCPKEKLENQLSELLKALSEKDLIQNDNYLILVEISKCLKNIVYKLSSNEQVKFDYFNLLVQLQSVPKSEKVLGYLELEKTTNETLSQLSQLWGLSIQQIYLHYFDQIINSFQSVPNWNQFSFEARIFENVVIQIQTSIIQKFHLILDIFIQSTLLDRDFELRYRMLNLLIKIFSLPLEKSDYEMMLPLLQPILESIVIRNCTWRAGKKAMEIRSTATTLLLILLNTIQAQGDLTTLLAPIFETLLLPNVLSNLDDDDMETRKNCLTLFTILLKLPLWTMDQLKKFYPELLKRLDDANDGIRIQSTQVWKSFFHSLQYLQTHSDVDFAIEFSTQHHQVIIQGLLIHLDDTNSILQESVCEALKVGKETVLDSAMFTELTLEAKLKHRSTLYLDQL
ncbi:armadillo-type protein [Globomyces pollinis-pini]|nr:armadillo-type protein [Globomyces pollinis-pini]